jgi:hypothetical protein
LCAFSLSLKVETVCANLTEFEEAGLQHLFDEVVSKIVTGGEGKAFLAKCGKKEIEAAKLALTKFEKGMEVAKKLFVGLGKSDALPFKDEAAQVSLLCRVMSVKWGVYMLQQRLLDNPNDLSPISSLKALRDKHLVDKDIAENMPDGLIDMVQELIAGEKAKGADAAGKKVAKKRSSGAASSSGPKKAKAAD